MNQRDFDVTIKDTIYNYFIYYADSEYPKKAPYNPERKYPEYPFTFFSGEKEEKNDVYRMVRELFVKCKLDIEHYGSSAWNPLGNYIRPGDTILIKPNLVMHDNPSETDIQKKMDCLITHPSLTRCLFDYVYIALKGKGKIIIADAPVQDCKFDVLLEHSGYGELFRFLEKCNSKELVIDIADLRDIELEKKNGRQRQRQKTDNKYNGRVVDLKNDSFFEDVKEKNKFRITNYASGDTVFHHSKGKNEYCVSEAMLEADVIINLPKPKTHRIAGYTAALKNMIGINTRKEYLPHHKKGAKERLGDEYIGTHRIWKWLNSTGNDIKNWALKYQINVLADVMNGVCKKTGKKLDALEDNRKKFGMWYGNDTIWRTILDVNKIVYFSNKTGNMCTEKQRKVLHFGDMIVCGEKEGPMRPTYKKVGGILFSDNPVSFDYCVVKLMGFDYKKIPTLYMAIKNSFFINKNVDVRLCSNNILYNKKVDLLNCSFDFEPSSGWKNYL